MPRRRALAPGASWLVILIVVAACGGGGSGDDGDDTGGDDTGGDDTGSPDAGPGDVDARPPRPDAAVSQTLLCGSPAACCDSGDDCVEGACVAACPSGIRCGADQLTCCDSGQVCVDQACATPTAACLDSFDCAEDEFCEPTLGQCLPQPTTPGFCQVEPEFDDYRAEPDWTWTGHTDATGSDTRTYDNVSVTPMVADVDVDGVPDVIFTAYPTVAEGDFRLFVIDGQTGITKIALPLATLAVGTFQSVAVGNLDADPELELVGVAKASTRGAGVFVLDDLATTPRVSCAVATGSLATQTGSPTLANLDADPEPEIMVAGIVVNRDCTVAFDARAGIGFEGTASNMPAGLGCNGGNGCLAGVADLDGVADQDGAGHPLPELVGGAVAYRFDKAVGKWRVYWDLRGGAEPNDDGFVAIADVLADRAGPEVVVVSAGRVYLRDGRTGALVPYDTGVNVASIGGNGGPPTIADFDGDGRVEFASAGTAAYRVYDPDCKATRDPTYCQAAGSTVGVLWSRATQDLSSSVTGSSVFDFQGDGAAEVVYNDECYLRVYDGATGAVLMERENSSRTSTEYPIVVDVDGDNRSEFVVVANRDKIERDNCPYCVDGQPCGKAGVSAFGDPENRWMRTRRVWNQHAYHVTNVSPLGEVPAVEPDNWTTPGLNNYRQNVQGTGVFNAPDLAISGVAIDVFRCPTIDVQVRVTNQGALGVAAGIAIELYRGDSAAGTLVGTMPTTTSLLPGASETLTFGFEPPAGDRGPFDFYVRVGDTGGAVECTTDNNAGGVSGGSCSVVD
jgi:hypothetical protein